MPSSTRTTEPAWPEGVIARYLTLGGATADVIDATAPTRTGAGHNLDAVCTGELCGWKSWGSEYWFASEQNPRDDDGYRHELERLQVNAQSHAEKCRAMPRPTGR